VSRIDQIKPRMVQRYDKGSLIADFDALVNVVASRSSVFRRFHSLRAFTPGSAPEPRPRGWPESQPTQFFFV
jgi:hypothetical protein